eukprot:SAG25_NODE_29_length_20738_cov_25.829546_9_plen_97_part_00
MPFVAQRPYTYGQYLHILTPAGALHISDPPWEGITGRVKHLQKQQTNRLMVEMDAKLKGVEAKLEAKIEAKLGDVQTQLKNIKEMLSTLTHQIHHR